MTKEKKKQLEKYKDSLKDRLADKIIPQKHLHRVESYHQFLRREIEGVDAVLEAHKLENMQQKS